MSYESNDPWIDPMELLEANRRHDNELAAMGIEWDGKVRSSWNQARLVVRGRLTDKRIEKYEKAGFYSAEYREARRKLAQRRSDKRKGNFIERDGKFIYSPI